MTMNMESLKAQIASQVAAQVTAQTVGTKNSGSFARSGNIHELNAVIMHRGGSVGCVAYQLNGSHGTVYNKYLFNVGDKFSMPSLAVLEFAGRFLEMTAANRAKLAVGTAERTTRVRLTMMDAAAITAFSMQKLVRNGVADAADKMIEQTSRIAVLNELDKSAIRKFVDAYVSCQALGVPVYFQKYVNAVHWDIDVPEGVDVKPGDKITFNGVESESGIRILNVNLTRQGTYTVGKPYFCGRNADGTAKMQNCVVRPNTSIVGRRMSEAIQKLWAMLPEDVSTETEIQVMSL